MKKSLSIILSVMWAFTVGCNREGREMLQDDGQVEFSIMMGTKAGSPGDVTYRALLLDRNSLLYTGFNGSYRQKDAKEWMTPCQVNNTTGEWIADDSQYGLRTSQNNPYYLLMVSPAIAPNWVYPDPPATAEKKGYHLTRSGSGISFSKPVLVNVNGNHLNRKYNYEFPQDNLLIDHRAKVTVQMVCGDDLTSVHIKKIEFKDIYEDAKFNLATDSIEFMTVDAVGQVLHSDADPVMDLMHGDAPTTVVTDFYLFALNYLARDDEYHYVYSIPRLLITMADDSRVSVPFYHVLKSQYSYTYTLTINSAFVKFDATAEPWTEYGAVDHEIEQPYSGTFTITPASDWLDGGSDSGTID